MNLRTAIAADIPLIMELERTCPTAAHWTQLQYSELFQAAGGAERLVLVAEASSVASGTDGGSKSGLRLLGFLVARHLAPEWELENIAVAPDTRRQGIGERLLNALLTRAKETNSEVVFLQVRESNTAAMRLYEKAGFHQTGRRKSYYTQPQEDAILYRQELS